MQFVLSKCWWISNTCVTLWYLPNIRRHLVSDWSNFSPDRHFLPPDVWPLYSNLSKQREGEGLQGDPEGPWGVAGVGGGEGHRQKTAAHVTWAPANRPAASCSAATRNANKGNVATPAPVHENDANRGGSAQGTPGTVRVDCWPLRAAAFILAPCLGCSALWWCWLSTGQKSHSSQQNYRPWCQLYTNILYSHYNCIVLYVVTLPGNNRVKVFCITSMVLQPGGNDAVKRVPLS